MINITAIRELTNSTNATLELFRVRTRESAKVPPRGRVDCNIWVPWADTVKQFNAGERIVLQTPAFYAGGYYVPAHPFFWVWQQGDFVRFSTDGKFHPNGDRVEGDSRVGGDRSLEISVSGVLPAMKLRA